MAIEKHDQTRIWKDLNPKVRRRAESIMKDVTFKDGVATYNKTGEDVSHMVDIGIKATEKQVRRLKAVDELSQHEIENGGFIIAFFKQLNTIEQRFPTLSKQDTARLLFIGTFIAWETNRLQADNGRSIIDRKKLEGLVEMSTKRFKEFFRRIEDEGIIRETESGELFINPTIFYRGEMKKHPYDISDYKYTRIFKETVRDLYKQFKGRTLAQLAVVYSVIPFLNFNTNIVSFNPEETDEDLIEPMNLDNLAELLGYADASSLKRTLNRIKVDGKPVFGFFENPNDRRKYRIVINPRVIFAGNGDSLRAVKALFN